MILGIKHVIQNHFCEVQVKYQDRLLSLELDVLQRDEVISQLQHRIQELEENPSTQRNKMNRVGSSAAASLKSGSSGSIDIPFVVSVFIEIYKGKIDFSNVIVLHFSVAIRSIQYFYHHHHPNTIDRERK